MIKNKKMALICFVLRSAKAKDNLTLRNLAYRSLLDEAGEISDLRGSLDVSVCNIK